MTMKVANSETEPAEIAEPGTEQVPTTDFDPNTVPMDELRAKIEQEYHENAQSPEEPDSEVLEPDTPDEVEVAAEPDETVAEDAPTDEQATEEADVEAEELPQISQELLLARLEETDARAKHFESLQGQRAGNEGFLQQQIQQLQAQLAAAIAPTSDDTYGDPSPERLVVPATPALPDSTTRWAVERAIKDSATDAVAGRNDLYLEDGKTVNPDFASIVERRKDDLLRINAVTDPVTAGQQMRGVMGSILSEFDVTLKQRVREEVEKRSGDQAARLKDKKRASASASSGSAPPPRPKTLDPMTMPLDELKKRIASGRFT